MHSVVVLLRPAADSPDLSGQLRYRGGRRRGKLIFDFEIVRLWRQPVKRILKGGLGSLPLAPLCRLPNDAAVEKALPGIVHQIDERLTREATPAAAAKLWTAAFILSGLRVSPDIALPMFRGVHGMKESSTYQWIVNEGRTEGITMGLIEGRIQTLQEVLLLQGGRRFGSPDNATRAAIQGTTDVERLKRMTERLLDVPNWQDLLGVM